jgi:hypothetical protein
MKKEFKKGDKKVFFGITFTYNGEHWVADYLSHPKVKKYEK